VEWHIDFLKKIYESAEFKKYVSDGALKPSFLTGPEYVKWVERKRKAAPRADGPKERLLRNSVPAAAHPGP
jgi:tripartite-type tricarboxylate transporter receptor subunit TctC